jgi:hypothetical protein
MIGRTLVLLTAIAATGVPARAEDTNPLVGTWRIVSFERENVDTKAVSKAALDAGFATYTPDGRMSFMAVDAKRKPPVETYATDDEAISLYRTMNAYVGSYRIQGDQIHIHIDFASNQMLSNTDAIRFFKIDGDRLTSTTPPEKNSFLKGQTTIAKVVYERVK